MYFIPRNNSVYNYIAHTTIKRRYCATLFFIAMLGVAGFYGLYMPLTAHIALSKIEMTRLQKQHDDSQQLKRGNKELLTLIHTQKKNIAELIIPDDKKEEHCHNRIQFVFDTVNQLELTLNSYGSYTEKDKKWYVKDSAHCQVTGTLEKLLSFLKIIKDSNQMIILSHLSITRVKEDVFQLSCDIGIITLKE